MDVRARRIVIDVSEADGKKVRQQLAEMIRRDAARGLPTPTELLTFANRFGAAVQDSASSAQAPQMPTSGLRGTSERFRSEPFPSSFAEPVRLSVREAANLANCSEGYMRRCCRRGDVQALQGHRGWAVDIASLATWISARHRKEHDNRKAA